MSGSCFNGFCSPHAIATGLEKPTRMATDGDHVYWVEDSSSGGGVYRVPVGAVDTTDRNVIATNRAHVLTIAVGSSYVFWVQGDGDDSTDDRVFARPIALDGVEVLVQDAAFRIENSSNTNEVIAARFHQGSDYLYVLSQSSSMNFNLHQHRIQPGLAGTTEVSGGQRACTDSGFPTAVWTDAEAVYTVGGTGDIDRINNLPFDAMICNSPNFFATLDDPFTIQSTVRQGGSTYLSAGRRFGATSMIWRMEVSGFVAQFIAPDPGAAGGDRPGYALQIAADDTFLYYVLVETPASSTPGVYRMPLLGGGTPERIASSAGLAGLVVAGDSLYFTKTDEGELLRMKIPPPTPDP